MSCAAKFVHSDCGGRQSKGQTPPKNWGNPGFTQVQGCTASEIVGFFAKDLILLHVWVFWKLTFVWVDQLSDHPGLVSLAHGDVGFLLAAGWWQVGMDCFPIPQKSRHIQRLARFKGKPYFFSKANCHWKWNISLYIQFQQLILDFNLRYASYLRDLPVYAKPSMG